MRKIILILSLLFLTTFVHSNEFINNKLNEQYELIDVVSDELMSMRLMIDSLISDNTNIKKYSQSLEEKIINCNEKINQLESNISSLKTSLLSNKEDTHEVISIIGEMQEEAEQLKKELSQMKSRIKRANDFVEIIIPTMSVPIIASGTYLYFFTDEKEFGKACIIGGTCILGCAEIVWHGGKLIFKLW